MALRIIFLITAAILLASIGWRVWQSGAVAAWTAPAAKPVPVVFDNGSMRELPPPPASGTVADVPAGGMRKCRRGADVTYTDAPCAPGFREQPIRGGSVNVVEATPVNASSATRPLPKLREALAPATDANLHGKRMERAIDGQ